MSIDVFVSKIVKTHFISLKLLPSTTIVVDKVIINNTAHSYIMFVMSHLLNVNAVCYCCPVLRHTELFSIFSLQTMSQ